MADSVQRGIRSAQAGMLINSALAATKLVAGIVGNTYALVADAVESATDIFSSLIVWGGWRWRRGTPTRTTRSDTARRSRSPLPSWR